MIDRRGIVTGVNAIGIEGAKFIEENIDPQFQAIEYLHKHVESEVFIPLVVANALVSYQLSGKGEDWWWESAKWFSESGVEEISTAYEEFLPRSRTNRRIVGAKIRRLRKIEGFLQEMDPKTLYEDMVWLWDEISRALGSPPRTKTVVFAVKMFGYAMRAAYGEFRPYPFEIPIPVDSRIKKLGGGDPIRFWDQVAKETKVPPLHIDSILWPALGGDSKIHRKIERSLGRDGRKLIQLLSPYTAPRPHLQTVRPPQE